MRAKLVVTVGLPTPGVLGDQMVIDQARYLDLGRTRAPLLPRSEREMFDTVMSEPVRVWELASATGKKVTTRSGDVEVEVAGITGAVGDKAMARILTGHGLLFGDLEPVGADDVDAVVAALGPDPGRPRCPPRCDSWSRTGSSEPSTPQIRAFGTQRFASAHTPPSNLPRTVAPWSAGSFV